MLVHTHKVMPILSSMLMLIGFSDLVCRDGLLGGTTLYELASLKYCYCVTVPLIVTLALNPHQG